MSWNNAAEGDDSGDEMFQMSSVGNQEDSACVRLLSSSDDESRQQRTQEVHLPDLHFRRNRGTVSRSEQDKKFKLALISVLVIGITMIIIISVGLGIKLRNTPVGVPTTVPTCPSQENNTKKDYMPCGASFPWQEYRLPTSVQPSHYHLYLHPNLTTNEFLGKIHIIVTIRKTTDTIILHSKGLKLQKIAVHRGIMLDGDGGGDEALVAEEKEILQCADFDFVAIQCPEQLIPGQRYTIFVKFDGNLTSSLTGFYLSKYTTQLGENKTLATTQFESTYAREAFPCFDEPAYKANFSLSIVRDSQHSAISNMPVKSTKDIGEDLKLDVFETSVKMSTYLIAFIVSELGNVSRVIDMKSGQLKVSVFASRDKLENAEFALDVACKVIKFFEDLFAVAYPLPKLDLVAVPDFEAGAMENWGLVTYRETLILFNETTSSLLDKERVATVIAHELSHQWFGNLVTMTWWNDLWLNEGFASYMEYMGTDRILPRWELMQSFNIDFMQHAMAMDQSKFTHSISVPVESSVQIEEVFDDISYSKGACIISMVAGYLGSDTFFSGIGDYLRMYSYKNANNSDLVTAIANKVAGAKQQNIKALMNSWTTQPGFPVLTVSKSGDLLTVSQDRYLLPVPDQVIDHCTPPAQDSAWQIPLSYITSLSPTKPSWQFLNKKKSTFSVPGNPTWIKFNFDRQGYFVVHYEGELLDYLSKQLMQDHTVFSPSDRAGIIYDLGQAAKAGYLEYSRVLDILKYAAKEDEYQPLYTVYSILRDIEMKFRMQFDEHSHRSVKMFITGLLSSIYMHMGWPDESEEQDKFTHLQKKLRMLVVTAMCNFNYPKCVDEAQRKYLRWKENNTAIPSDYKIVVYSTGLELGGLKEWDHLWKIFSTDVSKDEQERKKMLRALCRTKDERKVTFLLEESLKGEQIRRQDTAVVLISLTSTKVGSLMVWKFLREKWKEFTAIHSTGSFSTRETVKSIMEKFTDEGEVAAASTFFEANSLTDIRYVKRAMDTARMNVHWVRKYQPQVIQWLHKDDAMTAR